MDEPTVEVSVKWLHDAQMALVEQEFALAQIIENMDRDPKQVKETLLCLRDSTKIMAEGYNEILGDKTQSVASERG